MQESEVLQTYLWAAVFKVFLKFAKYNVSMVIAFDSSTFWHRNLHDWPLLFKNITYKTFFRVRILLAMLGRLAFLVAKI
jgi:hypothetical protein